MSVSPRPLWDRVLVLVTEEKSGIVLPMGMSRDETLRGVVTAKGDEAQQVLVGDVVMFQPGLGHAIEVKIEGERQFLVCEHAILLVLDDATVGARGAAS